MCCYLDYAATRCLLTVYLGLGWGCLLFVFWSSVELCSFTGVIGLLWLVCGLDLFACFSWVFMFDSVLLWLL